MPTIVLPRRLARRAVCVLAVVGAAGLAGCGGAVTVTSTSTPVRAGSSAGSTAAVPTPSATLAGAAHSAAAPAVTGTGVPGSDVGEAVRAAIGSARSVTMTLRNEAGSGTAVVDLAHKAVRLQAGGAGGPVTLVHVGADTWVKGAGSVTTTSSPTPTVGSTRTPRPSTTTRTWLRLRSDGSDVLSRKLGGSADVEAMLRPDAFTTMLDGVLGDQVPIEGGTRTSFWVQPEAYVAAVRGGPDLAASITRPVTVVLELDDRSRPTRLTATLVDDKATIVDETRYSGWDEPVTIETPDPHDVADAPLPSAVGQPTETSSARARSTTSATARRSASSSAAATSSSPASGGPSSTTGAP